METAVILGTFDGLHEGHRAVIEKARGKKIVAVTFDIPPKAFFGGTQELLMLPSDKHKGLQALGVSEVLTLDFSRVFSMPAEEFFTFLVEKYSPCLIACGFNYRFGKGALGDIDMLSSLCRKSGIALGVANSVGEKEPVSSSKLRTMIANGDVKGANSQIFGAFGFTSKVLHGNSRGTVFGFPTINQKFPGLLVKPKFGVYKSRVIIDGKEYDSITNVGIRPTFKTDFIGCETFIKDFGSDIYEKEVTLKLIEFMRAEEKFSKTEALIETVRADIKNALGVDI